MNESTSTIYNSAELLLQEQKMTTHKAGLQFHYTVFIWDGGRPKRPWYSQAYPIISNYLVLTQYSNSNHSSNILQF